MGLLDGSNGLLSQWFNGNNPGVGLLSQPGVMPASPAAGSPFLPQQSLFGDTGTMGLIGRALRGAVAGSSAGLGYTGMGGFGAGALAGIQANRQRQQFQMQNMLAGQDFKQGQQQLVGGNLNNIFALQRVNAMRAHFNQPPVTLSDLNANPDLVNNPVADTAPQGTTVPQPGLNPAAQGGQPESVWQPPQSTAPVQPQPQPQPQPTAQPSDMYQPMRDAIDEQWMMDPSKAPGLEFDLAKQQLGPQQAGQIKTATDQAGFTSPSGVYSNVNDLAKAFQSQPEVKTMSDVKPNFEATLAAYNAYKPSMSLDQQLPNDYNFASGVLKMINPEAANTRPNSVEAVEEAKGYTAVWQKVVQQLKGGTGLTPEVRDSLMQIAKQRMAAYQSAYDAQVAGYTKRASLLPGVTRDMWDSNGAAAPAQGGIVQVKTDADYSLLPSGTKFTGPDGKLRIKP